MRTNEIRPALFVDGAYEQEQYRSRVGICLLFDRKLCGQGSARRRRCDRTPSRYSHEPCGRPVQRSLVRQEDAPGSCGVWSHRTFGRLACDTKPRMESGLATEVIGSSIRRPSRLPSSAKADRCGSVSRNRVGRCARRILFSAIRYSFWSRSCWFTMPVK